MQPGEKRYECTKQLWIDKSITSEVRNKKKNRIINIKKPHKKPHITVSHLKWEEIEIIVPDITHFVKGTIQGDNLTVLLFILSVNPLTYLVHEFKRTCLWET